MQNRYFCLDFFMKIAWQNRDFFDAGREGPKEEFKVSPKNQFVSGNGK